jgi:tetratricopeptide (TPR) repeat protein
MEDDTFSDPEAAMRQVVPMARLLLTSAMQRAVAAQGSPPTTAQGLVDRAHALAIPQLLARAQEAHRLADAATRLDPSLAAAWAQRADSAIDLFLQDFTSDRARLLAEADTDSLKAVTIDPRDAELWSIRAQLLGLLGNVNAALEADDRARDLDPTRLYPLIVRGWLYLQAGRTDDAARTVTALRQGATRDAGVDLLECTTKLFAGAYAAAVPLCERSSAASPDAYVYAHLAAAYAMNGDAANAAGARAALVRASPDFTLARYEAKRLYPTSEGTALERAHLIAGLRKAGVPE